MTDITPMTLLSIWQAPEQAVQFDDKQWSRLLTLMRHEKLCARFAYHFNQHDITGLLPSFVQRHLTNANVIAERHAKQVHFELAELKAVLDHSSDCWLVLKGAAYTAQGKKVSQGRIYNDIDVLVDRASIAKVECSLSIRGWLAQDIDDYDEAYYREWTHEIPPLQHSFRNTILDLHHNIVPLVSGRAPDMQRLLAHTRLTSQGIPILTEPAQAIHSAIHLFFNEECEYALRDLLDLHLLMQAFDQEDWDTYLALADNIEFRTEAHLATYFVHHHCGLEVPDQVKQSWQTLGAVKHIYRPLLACQHPSLLNHRAKWSQLLVAIRGHALKMPVTILCYHIAMKTYRGLVKKLFGEHVFTKQDDNTTRVLGPQPPKPRMENG